jgi:hypothetical protein
MNKIIMAQILVEEAPKWGIALSRNKDKLIIHNVSKCPPDFKEQLKEHKPEILDLLKAQREGLLRDCAPWLHIAKQVLDGEWDAGDSSTRESLIIGLRGINHQSCRLAWSRLQALPRRRQTLIE